MSEIYRDIYRKIEEEIPRLRRYARALTRDVTAADDLVQDCLARALAKVHLWQSGTDLRAWLFTILHNQYVNHVRRSVREGAAVALSETEPLLTSAPNQGKRLELRDLERAIARLPEEQRAVLLLVGLEGMRYEEVAAVLDVPVGTIRSRLSRGRELLRQLIGMSEPPASHHASSSQEAPSTPRQHHAPDESGSNDSAGAPARLRPGRLARPRPDAIRPVPAHPVPAPPPSAFGGDRAGQA